VLTFAIDYSDSLNVLIFLKHFRNSFGTPVFLYMQIAFK